MKCIIQYKGQDNECFCNKEVCSKCNNKDNRISKTECKVPPEGFCTCRLCSFAVKS